MAFFFAICYLIAEYMRPQDMYAALSGMHFAEVAIIGVAISSIAEGRMLVERNRNWENILILAYAVWFSVACLFALDRALAWPALINFSKWVIIYFLLTNLINDKKRLYIFVIFFLLLNFKYAQFAVRIWARQGFYTDPRGLNAGGGIGSGFFENPNDFGVMLNVAVGISAYMIYSDFHKILNFFKMRWFHMFATLCYPLAILASSSRGAALGLGAVIFGFWMKSKKKIIGIALVVITVITFIRLIPQSNWHRFQDMGTQEDKSSQTRIELWKSGIAMAEDHPITGVGPNNFIFANQHFYNPELRVVQHNIFIQALSELGIPGLIIFLLMVVWFFKNNKEARRLLDEKSIGDPILIGLSHGLDISLVGFLVNGFFITVLYYPFFWTILTMNVALLDTVKKLNNTEELDELHDAIS